MRGMLLAVLLLVFGNIVPVVCMGETLPSVIDKKLDNFEVYKVTVSEAIEELATKCEPLDILITFEEAVGAQRDKLISIKLKNVSIRNIVSEITNKDKSYSWSNDANIINFIPSNKKDDISYILNENISELTIQNKTREEIVEIVLEEINKSNPEKYKTKNKKGVTVNKLILVPFPYEEFGSLPPVLKRHDIEIRNKTVREILNLIAIEENVPWAVMLLERDEDNIRLLFFGSKE